MLKLDWSYLVLILAVLSLAGSGCEIREVLPEDKDQPADSSESQTNALLQVISEENVWGGGVITEVDRVMSLLKLRLPLILP